MTKETTTITQKWDTVKIEKEVSVTSDYDKWMSSIKWIYEANIYTKWDVGKYMNEYMNKYGGTTKIRERGTRRY